MCEMTDERPAVLVSCNAAQHPYLVPLVEMLSSGSMRGGLCPKVGMANA